MSPVGNLDPPPPPGTVMRYAFLFVDEQTEGQEEGEERPCVLYTFAQNPHGVRIAIMLAITHSAPRAGTVAVEIPPIVKGHLGLDEVPSWIVCDQVNAFLWPGPDLRRIPSSDEKRPRWDHGRLPRGLYDQVKAHVARVMRAGQLRTVKRS